MNLYTVIAMASGLVWRQVRAHNEIEAISLVQRVTRTDIVAQDIWGAQKEE